jgi:hypothetical protein
MKSRVSAGIKALPRDELDRFVSENVQSFTEDEALAVLENPNCNAPLCQALARNPRITAFYAVRLALVEHRQTPQAHATKLVHYLYWPDLVRLSVEVKVPPPVRRSIDNLLLGRVDKLTLGEKIATARRCSEALIKTLLFDPDPKVFAALLVNQRLREEHLLLLAGSTRVSTDQLALIAGDRRWSFRYAIRKALVMNPLTPRAAAASQLRFLSRRDRNAIYENPGTSVYIRRCIERLQQAQQSAPFME